MFSEASESISNDAWFNDRHIRGLLHELLSQLAAALSIRRAHIATAISNDSVRLAAAWQDGAPAPAEGYPIANTPCAEALANGTYTVINSDTDLFPQLRILGKDPTRGYVSHPIVNSAGSVFGHICLLNNLPIRHEKELPTVLSLVAGRIAAEVEHENHDRRSSNQIRDIQALLANLPGMVYQCRYETGWSMQYVSDGSVALSGYNPQELIDGQPGWTEIIHPDDREVAWNSVQRALKQGKIFQAQYRIQTRDQGCKWVMERGCVVDADQNGTLVEGFVSDITPLREGELELEQAETLVQSIVESIADGVLLIDSEGRIERMNNAAMQMLGVRRDAVADHSIGDFLGEGDCKRIEAEVRQFDESGESRLFASGMEMSGIRSDQETFPAHVRVRQMPVDSKTYYVASVCDVSDRKTREAELIRQNERMTATIEYAPIGIMTFDRDLCIVAANSTFADMIGLDPSEILGRQLSAFAHPNEVAKITEAARSSLTGNVTHYSMRTRYVHKDGHSVHASLHVALGYDDEGRPDFGVASIEDLTSRLSAAALIRDQRNERARIDRLSSLGEMTAGIAHEINQPLTAISTYAQAAVRFVDQGEIGSERLKEALTKLSEQSHRASSIIERIRALARQRKSQAELVDCSDLVRNTVDLIADDTGDPGIRFRMELMPHPPLVLCDPAQLQQVISNLVRNAIESMQRAEFRGGKDIILKTEATDTGDVRIFVVDSGLGVDDSISNTLFEPFSTNAPAGLGMGLSTARSVLRSFGGKVEFRNNASQGATFSITLPGHSGETSDEQSSDSDNS